MCAFNYTLNNNLIRNHKSHGVFEGWDLESRMQHTILSEWVKCVVCTWCWKTGLGNNQITVSWGRSLAVRECVRIKTEAKKTTKLRFNIIRRQCIICRFSTFLFYIAHSRRDCSLNEYYKKKCQSRITPWMLIWCYSQFAVLLQLLSFLFVFLHDFSP